MKIFNVGVMKGHIPTTRDALCFPSGEAAYIPSGITVDAILVIEIEDVFDARIASGRSSEAKDRKIVDLRETFSDTA